MTRFSGYLLLFDGVSLVLAGVPMYFFSGLEVVTALLIALLITTLLAIISFFPFTRMSNASINHYMAAILFGMLIRMVFIGLAVAIVFVYSDLHKIGFTVGLLFSYICKTVIETFLLTRKHRGHTSVL